MKKKVHVIIIIIFIQNVAKDEVIFVRGNHSHPFYKLLE